MANRSDKNWFPIFIGTLIPIVAVLVLSLAIFPDSILKNWTLAGIGISFLFFVFARAVGSNCWDLIVTWGLCLAIIAAYVVHDCFKLL